VRPDSSTLQVVLGPIADQVAGEIRTASKLAANMQGAKIAPRVAASPAAPADKALANDLLAALGGAVNVRAVQTCSTRARVELVDERAVNQSALAHLGVRGVVRPEQNVLHILIGPRAAAVTADMELALTN
jgi:PTS system N-acetylglucosamine-specific IIC component